MMRLSFLMPVKNASLYLDQAVSSIQDQEFSNWELIIVNDHSEDGTADIVKNKQDKDGRIQLFSNPGNGQVQALNHGYLKTSGDFIKFMDGDDILAPSFSNNFESMIQADASYHDADIVDLNLKKINRLRMTSKFKDSPFTSFLDAGVVHPPRWAWMFSRKVGEKLFPMPQDLVSPHEDYWISLVIKKYARTMTYVNRPLYFYRQYPEQFFGGIYNFSPELVRFRASAMLKIIDLIERRGDILINDIASPENFLLPMRDYYTLLAREKVSCREIFRIKQSGLKKSKLFILKKIPLLASLLSRYKSSIRFFKNLK